MPKRNLDKTAAPTFLLSADQPGAIEALSTFNDITAQMLAELLVDQSEQSSLMLDRLAEAQQTLLSFAEYQIENPIETGDADDDARLAGVLNDQDA